MDIISTFNSTFTINRLTEEQYNAAKEAGEISGYHDFEFYLTEGDSGGGGGGVAGNVNALCALTKTDFNNLSSSGSLSSNYMYFITDDAGTGGGSSIHDYLSSEEWIFTMDDSSTRTVKMAVWKN